MDTILFILTSGKMRAFVQVLGETQPLKYQGNSWIPYTGSRDVQEFVRYMVNEYSETSAEDIRLAFICEDGQSMQTIVRVLQTDEYPHVNIASLRYYLSLYLYIQGLDDRCVKFDDKSWYIKDGISKLASATMQPSFEIQYKNIADSFFRGTMTVSSKPADKLDLQKKGYTLLTDLQHYVEESKVARKYWR